MLFHRKILDLLERARRRRIWHLVVEQAAIAISLGMGAAILLLVLGTQILDWYWPVALLVVSLGIGLYRLRKRLPDRYRLLQEIDGRLGLRDSLSTAYYFGLPEKQGLGRRSVREAQQAEASELARSVDLSVALPFRAPAAVYVALVAGAAAVSLFGLRYGIRHSLDLQPPISNAVLVFFRPTKEMAKAWNEEHPETSPETVPLESRAKEREQSQLDREADSRLNAADASGVPLEGTADDTPPPSESTDPWETDSSPNDSPEATGDSDTPPPDDGRAEKPDAADSPKFPEADSDLLRKMENAFADLLSKLKIPPQAGQGRKMVSSEARKSSRKKSRNQWREQAELSPEGDSSQTTGRQGRQTQPGGQQARAGRTNGPGKRSDQAGRQGSRSGAGRTNGVKNLKLARQIEAMGKLEEILGKRAKRIKGDIMVEVSSGPQRLKTAYTGSEATHRAAGGEIHRDEVPIELQDYVQRYFEEVRNQPSGSTTPTEH